jgi:cytochrome c1
MVGPPLDGVGRRAVIAGMLENTPQNLAHWIRHPQSVVPGNAMPDLGLSRQDANDIAAYLYSES